jgi:hypothetical protein
MGERLRRQRWEVGRPGEERQRQGGQQAGLRGGRIVDVNNRTGEINLCNIEMDRRIITDRWIDGTGLVEG